MRNYALQTRTRQPILLPLDLSRAAEPALLSAAAEQARAFEADLIPLHVLPARSVSPDGEPSAAEARARTHLDVTSTQMRLAGARAKPLVLAGKVGPTIVDAADRYQAALIVIGGGFRRGLTRLLPGRGTNAIARHAPCPTLLVRPAASAGSGLPAAADVPVAPNESVVRSFSDDSARAGPVAAHMLGLRTVAVARIVGSVGRSAELGADFRPRDDRLASEGHRRGRRAAMDESEHLAPVELYQLGYGYYVLDGHRRVAAANRLDQVWIDATVTQFVPDADADARRVIAERRTFESATGITRIEAARPGSYARLEALIREYDGRHGYADLHEAAIRWYAQVCRPLALRLRARLFTEYLPGERAADIVGRAVSHRRFESRRQGRALGWEEVLESLGAAPSGRADAERCA